MSFAEIEASINAAATAALANATMTWGVASSASGVFRDSFTPLLGDMVAGSDPTFTGLTSAIGAIAYGTAVSISSVAYTVARNEPDGAGMTTLALQKA